MESKRLTKSFNVGDAAKKRAKLSAETSATAAASNVSFSTSSAVGDDSSLSFIKRYLSPLVNPTQTLQLFLLEARFRARQYLQSKGLSAADCSKNLLEIEVRLGMLKAPFGRGEQRIISSGAKLWEIQGRNQLIHAFLCSAEGLDATKLAAPATNTISTYSNVQKPPFEGGITRAHFTKWTSSGLSEPSPISLAYGCCMTTSTANAQQHQQQPLDEIALIKKDLNETETIQTVYGGYSQNRRVCFSGHHPSSASSSSKGVMESKVKLQTMDIAIPSAPYDLRITLSTEDKVEENLVVPPPNYLSKRLKRRRSYNRRDKSFAWQLDVTEVTTTSASSSSSSHHNGTNTTANNSNNNTISYEIEIELLEASFTKLIQIAEDTKAQAYTKQLAEQLWWMMRQINPLLDVLDVHSYLLDHTSSEAVKLALAQCYQIKKFLSEGGAEWNPAIPSTTAAMKTTIIPTPPPKSMNFIGCMPVNFQRHNIEEIQRCSNDNSYFVSEKTDGIRYLMIFTGSTVVLLDRSNKGYQPRSITTTNGEGNDTDEPMKSILHMVQPGTVLDGEVVIHRELRRPIFIVFDVLCSGSTPILHLPFEERLRYLTQGIFATTNNAPMLYATCTKHLQDKAVTLPLVKKNFVRRTEIDVLLSHVQEERGIRTYRNGDCHNHTTDGIIFQGNRPYVIGTDIHLLKWKYLDTVTIDVELLPDHQYNNFHHRSADDTEHTEAPLRVGVLGEEGTIVDMTRYIKLPRCERLRLEADRAALESSTSGNKGGGGGPTIVEVGFDPDSGDWFYQTMRPDKKTSNHISTVLGTLLELAESLGTNELIYRMSIPTGQRDTYRKDIRSMQKQLLDFQIKKKKQQQSHH
jgi:hypothetical protein